MKNYFKPTKIKECFSCSIKQEFNKHIEVPICENCIDKYFTRPSGDIIFGYDRIRILTRIRDNFTCQKCGTKKYGKRNLDVHHIDGFCGMRGKNKRDSYKNIDFMVTLCHKCHLNLEEVKNKMKRKR